MLPDHSYTIKRCRLVARNALRLVELGTYSRVPMCPDCARLCLKISSRAELEALDLLNRICTSVFVGKIQASTYQQQLHSAVEATEVFSRTRSCIGRSIDIAKADDVDDSIGLYGMDYRLFWKIAEIGFSSAVIVGSPILIRP